LQQAFEDEGWMPGIGKAMVQAEHLLVHQPVHFTLPSVAVEDFGSEEQALGVLLGSFHLAQLRLQMSEQAARVAFGICLQQQLGLGGAFIGHWNVKYIIFYFDDSHH